MQDPDPTQPEFPVHRQLEAYNARDIDAFMQWWADDCRYYQFPDQLLAIGTAEIRERHVVRFQEPNLHGRLVKRIAVADVVVDQETVTRTFSDGSGEVDVVAIYQIENGKIANAWFKMGAPRPIPRAPRSDDRAWHAEMSAGDGSGMGTTAPVLRRAGPADAAAVRDLTRAAYAKWVPLLGREPRPMIADYDAVVRDHRVDLLQVDSDVVGLVELAPGADHLLIVNVAVAPACQGRGYGRALMAHAEQVAASLGLGEMRLYTNGRFTENLRLYRQLGYAVDREEEHEQFGTTIYMAKRLAAGDRAPS